MQAVLSLPPVLASLRAALDQPVFPGKVVVWLLFMLSIVGWVMILSKAVQFRRSRRSDHRFTERLRKSKTTLEVYEEGGREDDASLKHLVYQAGARETAYQLLGSREPQDSLGDRIRQAGKLSERQLEHLRAAFETGFRSAAGRLGAGIEGLKLIGTAALLLGAFGFAWTLMNAFDETKEFAELAPKVGGALGHVVIALMVAGPAILARMAFLAMARRRTEELERFRSDILRLFERSFAAAREAVASGRAAGPEPAAKEEAGDPARSGDERKRYHSIRDRLLRSEPDEPEPTDLRMNPIARQTTGGGLRGY